MARHFLEELIFTEMERSANKQGTPRPMTRVQAPAEGSDGDFFEAIKNGIRNYRNVFGFFPFMRRSTEEPPVANSEHIEMAHFENGVEDSYGDYDQGTIFRAPAKGHDFQAHQLTHPTWCDECGDFIWGAYKQCLKCNNCQYTCHHQCMPLIQLECKSVTQEQEDEGAVLSGETTLSDLNLSHQAASGEPLSEPATEKDETDSGYRSGTIPDEKLPPRPSDATLNRDQLKKRIAEFNKHVHGANFALKEEESGESKESFQGFIKVVLNLMRPISMSLGARPPSIYEVLTREHIIEQNTQHISFYMPRDTVRSIHAHSSQTTKEVVTLLLKKFHILDHPRKFALYEQELKNNKIACIRRVKDGEFPLAICLSWDLENINNHRLVLQENETGEVDWEAFCKPELNNFLRVLDREEKEYIAQLEYKYKVMRRLILQRMKELRLEAERERRGAATS